MYMAASPVPIYTYCVGMCASAESMLFLGGHKRYIYPGSWLMFHDAWMFSYASDGEDHRRQADWHEKLDEEAVDFIHARTGLDKTLIKDECSKDNWWISSSDAVKQGFATHLGDE